ncbi:MAG: hypothetical protein CL908_14095 [Deltaproteobacteria bacterium]|nr:hypothetical protein [Deltaproteobacteria bacterium]
MQKRDGDEFSDDTAGHKGGGAGRRSRRRDADQTPGYRKILAGAADAFGRLRDLRLRKDHCGGHRRKAQVSKPLFYRYFENKEHVFEVVASDTLAEWNAVLADAVSRAANTADALRMLHETSLDYARTLPFVHRLFAPPRPAPVGRSGGNGRHVAPSPTPCGRPPPREPDKKPIDPLTTEGHSAGASGRFRDSSLTRNWPTISG